MNVAHSRNAIASSTVLDSAGAITTDCVSTAIRSAAVRFEIPSTSQPASKQDVTSRIWRKACAQRTTSGDVFTVIRSTSASMRRTNLVACVAVPCCRPRWATVAGTTSERPSTAIRWYRCGRKLVADRFRVKAIESSIGQDIRTPTGTDDYQNTAGSWRKLWADHCRMMRTSITSMAIASTIDRRIWNCGHASNHAGSGSLISLHGRGRFSAGTRVS